MIGGRKEESLLKPLLVDEALDIGPSAQDVLCVVGWKRTP